WKSRRIQERVNMRNLLKQGGKLSEPRTRFGRGRGDAVGGGDRGNPEQFGPELTPGRVGDVVAEAGDGAEATVQQAVPFPQLDLDSVPWQAPLAARGLLALKGRASKVEGIPRFFPNRIDASMRDGMRKTRNEKRSSFA